MKPSDAVPALIEKPADAIVMWTIYDHPRDFPDGYVLRPSFAVRGEVIVSPLAWYADDPDKLRAILPPGCVNLNRMDIDPPTILETWIE